VWKQIKVGKRCACRLGPLASQISQKELVQSTVPGFFCGAIAGRNENKGTEIGAQLVERALIGDASLSMASLYAMPFFSHSPATWMGDS